MADKKPLKRDGGITTEFGTGDTLPVANGGTGYTALPIAGNTKSSTQSVTSSTTPVNCTNISFPIGANETWNWELNFRASAGASGGLKWLFTLPSGATGNATGRGINNITTNFTSVAMTTGKGATTAIAGATDVLRLYGTVVSSSTAGTVQFQFAQNASNGTSTTIYENSTITAWRIA